VGRLCKDANEVSLETPATRKQIIAGQVNSIVLPRYLDLLDYQIFHYDRSVDPARAEYSEHVVFSFWHEYIGVILPRWGNTPLTVLCSQHRDGEWVNQTAKSLGLNIVRGSTTRGGSKAIRRMKKNSKFSSIAITPDGPRGPRRQMAIGAVYMASLLKMPIVPLGIGISNPHRLGTWDKFAIPKPSSRVRLVFGPKIYIPPKSSREHLENCRCSIEKLNNELTDHAQEWADSGLSLKGAQRFTRARRTNKILFDSKAKPRKEILARGRTSSLVEIQRAA
jgi:lysophospholipid acyltransferase (LPLAT)-like uncharacterized protein